MADSNASLKRPRSWPKGLMWFGIGFLILLVVLYFVATSTAFFKSVLLPRVGKSMNATITVSDASISPFSRVVLNGLKVTPNGKETLLTAQEVRVRYSLFKIIRGTMKVDEVAIISPVVELITAPDGSSNLDPILASQKDEPKKPDEKSEPLNVDLKKLALNNATVRSIKKHANGTRDVAELSNVNVTLDDLRNGQTAKLSIAADVKLANNPPGGQQGMLDAKLNGNFNAGFSQELKPTAVQGSSQFNVQNSSGALAELAGLSAKLNTDVMPTEVKQVALQFMKGSTPLGEVRAQGPLDLAKMEGKVDVLVLNIDRQVLNLAGAASGMDFGSTVVNSTNQIQLADAGKTIAALGQLAVAKLSIKREGQTTPPLDLQLAYDVSVNNAAQSADLRAFTLNGVQQSQNVLKGELTSPMRIAWGGSAATAGDSTFRLIVDSLNLGDWKAVIGDIAGRVNLTANVTSQQSGKQLGLDVTSQIDGLAMAMGTNRIQNVAVTLRTRGQAVDLKKITLPELRLEAAYNGQRMLALAGNVQMDRDAQTTEAQLTLDGAMPTLLATLSRPDASASSGALNGQLRVTQKGEVQSVSGKLGLVSFNGRFGEQSFNNFGINTELDAQTKGPEMELRKAAGTLTGGGRPGGSFDANGKYNSQTQSGHFDLKLANINENSARPFLEPAFKGKQLVSISVNGNASARFSGNTESAIKADFKVANLAVRDPKKPNPQPPLEVAFKLDAVQTKHLMELQKCELTLAPTQRAKNAIQITGRLDRSQTNAMQGNLKVVADSLDLTPYYDLVAGDDAPDAPSPGPQSRQPAPAPAQSQQEPEPINTPFRNTVAEIQIGRLFLREVNIANFRSTAKIDGSHVALKPFQMSLNGAPVDASIDLDLGVPGYKYDIAFNASKVPLEPLANSFSPEYKGRAKGQLLADVKIQGAGTTGVNLQKTLKGQTSLTFTNAEIQLVASKWNAVLKGISIPLRTDLTESPINWLTANVNIGAGNINITEFRAVSDAFIAQTQGAIPIADVLTNSPLRLPLELSLRRSLAQRVKLVPPNAPTNTDYVQLPTFARVSGTLGQPKSDTDEKVILGLIARSAVGSGVIGGDAGRIIGGLGGLLTGERNTNRPAATDTNAPSANTNRPRSLLDLIPRSKK